MSDNRSVCSECGFINVDGNCECNNFGKENNVEENNIMREFDGGATRNSDEGKYDYEGFLHPLVIERFAKYMNKHRYQADGKVRDSDNWQKLFGDKHCDVCMKSAFRHFHDWWKQHRGFKGQDILEESICALMFNAQAYLLKLLLDKEKNNV